MLFRVLAGLFFSFSFVMAPVFAVEIVVKVTPIEKISTTTKYMKEGNEVKFRITESNKLLNKDEILTGLVLYYEPNRFDMQQAKLTIGNFRTQTGKSVKGNLYINGKDYNSTKISESGKVVAVNVLAGDLFFLRGEEILVRPDLDILNFFTED